MRLPLYICMLALLTNCGGPEPRKPVKVKTGSFIKKSVERNKLLLQEEEKLLHSIMTADSANHYMDTDFGAWYYYNTQNQSEAYLPVEDDRLTMVYNIIGLENDTIYSEEEIGTVYYRVDREELFPGLRMAVKLLKKGETATFLFPSYLAYGYHGDNNKIGPNVPVKSTISILNIEQSKDSILN